MRLRKLTLRHFRNIGFASLEFSGRQQFFAGANGQGKTNLLEAAGCLTALRSFRAADNQLLIAHGQATAAIAAEFEHERQGEARVTIKFHRGSKELWCEQTRVRRLADYLGQFPTVVFSSQDIALVRGAPAVRRRWLDLMLSAQDSAYLGTLQTFTRALLGRNALLKRGRPAEAELAAFEQTLAPAASELVRRRTEALGEFAQKLQDAYDRFGGPAERARLAYEPNVPPASAEAFAARWEAGRARDLQFRSTLSGPHRDELAFRVKGTAARDFASEGQQRSLVLAVRLAQARWLHEKTGIRPVLLADDVLGELDPLRREKFWAALDPESQILATGTRQPEASLGAWQGFVVADGTFTPEAPVEA